MSLPDGPTESDTPVELTILMPCLDEAETVGICVRKARAYLERSGVQGEVLVADNGSRDGSREIAEREGARVVPVEARGYGAALQGGIQAARGRFVIMGDADDSYDFSSLDAFLERLRAGDVLVMGNRFLGGIKPGAMPPLHRYLGNPVLSGIGRLFFDSPIGDFHCGLRGFDRRAILSLDLRTMGMEFASEMVVKATLRGLRIAEVPTTLSPDGRSRPPHLRSWRDGWRHLRFLLLYSPEWLFVYPGLALLLVGLTIAFVLIPGPLRIFGANFDVHTLLYGGFFVLLGFQALAFGMFTKVFAIAEGLLPEDPKISRLLKLFSLEGGLAIGALLVFGGLLGSVVALKVWDASYFGNLNPQQVMRIVIPAGTALTLGVQILLSSFFLSVLRLRRR